MNRNTLVSLIMIGSCTQLYPAAVTTTQPQATPAVQNALSQEILNQYIVARTAWLNNIYRTTEGNNWKNKIQKPIDLLDDSRSGDNFANKHGIHFGATIEEDLVIITTGVWGNKDELARQEPLVPELKKFLKYKIIAAWQAQGSLYNTWVKLDANTQAKTHTPTNIILSVETIIPLGQFRQAFCALQQKTTSQPEQLLASGCKKLERQGD